MITLEMITVSQMMKDAKNLYAKYFSDDESRSILYFASATQVGAMALRFLVMLEEMKNVDGTKSEEISEDRNNE